jgi:hypothetical protein
VDVKLERLTREGKTYRLAIYELGKDPSVISWRIGSAFLTITIPGLCEEKELGMGGKEYRELMAARKQRSEQRLRDVLARYLRYAELLMRERTGAKVDP